MSAETSLWKRIRKVFNDIHLWMGIGAGLVLFVVCLTGTIYTFHTEIEEWIEPERYFVEVPAGAEPMATEKLIRQVETQLDAGTVGAITVPANPKRAYILNIKKEGERRGSNYYVDPYTAELTGEGPGKAAGFFRTVFRLHRWLLLDTSIGRPITGWATVIFVFLVLTGLVIWFPQRIKSWKQGLKIKWKANWKRVNHDLHNALGFYASFFLLIMGLTGLFWSFEGYRSAWYATWGVERGGNTQTEAEPAPIPEEGETLGVAELLAITNQELDYKGNVRLSLPDGKNTDVFVRKNKVGFFAPAAGDQMSINAYTGAITSKDIFSEKPFPERVGRSVKALHVGDVFGTFSKIIYFLSCLIATSLPITGTLIWINKLKKKSKRKRKAKKPELVATEA